MNGILALGYSVFIAKPAYKEARQLSTLSIVSTSMTNPRLTGQFLSGKRLQEIICLSLFGIQMFQSEGCQVHHLIWHLKVAVTVGQISVVSITSMRIQQKPTVLPATLRGCCWEKSSLLPRSLMLQRWKKRKHRKHRLLKHRRNTIIGVLAGGILMVCSSERGNRLMTCQK